SKRPGSGLLRHYELSRLGEEEGDLGLSYQIEVSGREAPYQLDLDSLLLNIYDTGVGVLTFFLGNRRADQASPQDILNINQFGRRTAPPFFSIPGEKVGKQFDMGGELYHYCAQLDQTQKLELAFQISIAGDGIHPVRERFTAYIYPKNFARGPFLLPKFLSCWFPSGEICTQESVYSGESQKAPILLKPVLDDRMFVACWYGGMEKVKEAWKTEQQTRAWKKGHPTGWKPPAEPGFKDLGSFTGKFWYRFVFVDGKTPSIFNYQQASQFIEDHTYHRWTPYTFLGISRYSLVCLTSSLAGLRLPGVDAAFLPQHLESIYYKLFELSIIQRATVLRFADEVTHLSHFSREENAESEYLRLSGQVQNLYENYIRFVNKIYFREVTAQEQGIEMYQMLQGHMRIEKQVEDLDQEIDELHRYVKMLEEELTTKRADRTNKQLNALTFLGGLFLVPSFILGLYQNPVYASIDNPLIWVILILSLLVLGISSLVALGWGGQKENPTSRIVATIIAVIVGLLLLIMPLKVVQERLFTAGATSTRFQLPFSPSIESNMDLAHL
ncbi:MAG: hypothetical protein AAF399_17150, partial [Bacteroidota bacterium]